jgi:hypothetical protein
MKVVTVVLLFAATGVSAQSPSNKLEAIHEVCPIHAQSPLNERGEHAMGFSQTATVHHFVLTATGGIIQVEAKDVQDATERDSIRMHLHHIAGAFQSGDFDIPMFIHDTTPPGVPEMKRLQHQIRYSFEETPNGGRVVISSANKESVAAIHQFLRFQIEDHKTGDSESIR